jgi:hypothetical protein
LPTASLSAFTSLLSSILAFEIKLYHYYPRNKTSVKSTARSPGTFCAHQGDGRQARQQQQDAQIALHKQPAIAGVDDFNYT